MRILICHLFSRSTPADLGSGVGLDLDRDNLFLKPICCNYGEMAENLSLLFQQKTKGTFFFAFAEKVHRSIDN
jgi:hypothetical protein